MIIIIMIITIIIMIMITLPREASCGKLWITGIFRGEILHVYVFDLGRILL